MCDDDIKCWFCGGGDGEFCFTVEFDAYFHEVCLVEAMKDPEDREASIIAREWGKS